MDFQTRYEFDPKKDLLGKGGFSKVYKATDILLERTVALKFFTAKTADKYQVLNEIKKVIRFEHPNLCKYYDVALLNYKNVLDETEQMEVGIMEYIDAGDFKSYLKKHPEHTDKLLIDVLKGLAYLHKHGMAHRDLKPQNILIKMVDDEPVSKITDFGISKIVDADEGNSSALLGTVEYMAPEQFNPKRYGINGRIGTNLDLWSFGLLVYESLCQQSLFGSRSGGISAEQVMSNILGDPPPEKLDALPPKYKAIVDRCLVKHAAERVQNALELIPLFAADGAAETKAVAIEKATDSGKLAAAETEVLNLSAEAENEAELETQTVTVAPVDEELATEVFNAPVAEEKETEAMTPPEFATGETQVLQTNSGLLDATRPIEYVSPGTLRAEATAPVTALVEEPTQVINKLIAKPAVKETLATPNAEAARKAIQWQKPKTKGKTKSVLLVASAVTIISAAIYFGTSDGQSPVPPPPPPPPPPHVKTFLPPATLPVKGGTFAIGVSAAAGNRLFTVSTFELGRTEVTVGEFRSFVEDTRYRTTAEFKGNSQVFANGNWVNKPKINWRYDGSGKLLTEADSNRAVVHISWNDADSFCRWLSKKTGATYRLPTEAEWEFAAKGGELSKGHRYSGSNDLDSVGWYLGNAGGSNHQVGKKMQNELGLFDMTGNVLEWCQDYFDAGFYNAASLTNPVNTTVTTKRSIRGGAWGLGEAYCDNSSRYGFADSTSGGNIGFRIAKAIKN